MNTCSCRVCKHVIPSRYPRGHFKLDEWFAEYLKETDTRSRAGSETRLDQEDLIPFWCIFPLDLSQQETDLAKSSKFQTFQYKLTFYKLCLIWNYKIFHIVYNTENSMKLNKGFLSFLNIIIISISSGAKFMLRVGDKSIVGHILTNNCCWCRLWI